MKGSLGQQAECLARSVPPGGLLPTASSCGGRGCEQKALISVTEAIKDPSYSLRKAGSSIWVSGSHPHPDLAFFCASLVPI